MKLCPECNVVYENNLDVCPTCGARLENFGGGHHPNSSIKNQSSFESANENTRQADNTGDNSAYIFEQHLRGGIVINGSVAEANTQQYYQSKLTKFLHAVFSGEPYQFSHTSFVTIFRVEEHTIRGYPEQARDITLYGNMQNIFAVGDDVTVTAQRKGSRLVAKRVFNHSINSNVRIQPYIPASVIRAFFLIAVTAIVSILYSLINADYSAIGSGITALISTFLPTLFIIGITWNFIKGFFKKK
ncbi:MAG TPA: hypothetical protein DIV40_03060 [Clostridiales bacterium]|jgi:hypothetical protein|nr:hypothetical protein [Clostridiales bacterium]